MSIVMMSNQRPETTAAGEKESADLLFHLLVLKWRGWEPGTVISTLGRASLVVYWIHVEMVYGVIGRPLRRLLPLEASLTATAVLCLILYGIVRWRDRAIQGRELPRALRILSPILR